MSSVTILWVAIGVIGGWAGGFITGAALALRPFAKAQRETGQ